MREWILTPLIGAVIGYMTNWVAIKMLFRPHTEKRLFGLRLPFTPGLIPKERRALAKKLGDTLADKVLTGDVLAGALDADALTRGLDGLLDRGAAWLAACPLTIEEALSKLLGGEGAARDLLAKLQAPAQAALPRVSLYIRDLGAHQPEMDAALQKMAANIAREQFGGFIGIFVNYDKIYGNIKKSLCEYLDDPQNAITEKAGAALMEMLAGDLGRRTVAELWAKLPEGAAENLKPPLLKAARAAIERGGAYVARSMDIAKVVEDKLNGFETAEAERIIISVVNRELRLITMLGGLLGFIIGFVPPVMNALAR